ncbi:MAG: polyribonucleotide nucleotidyltransferase [Bernardetiaceae bacterium]|nr:polyribonucleotide nucleotidyltransferase [Bernardetiaceae bacterium]
MQLNPIIKTIELEDGRTISVETGRLAKQADGAVVVRMGKTMLLATVVSNKDIRDGMNFLPMSVEYQEKFAAAGKIPGGFIKREGRLSEHEILVCRLVDRALRPLFPDDFHAETQINISLISADEQVPPDALAAFAASAALAVSDVPITDYLSEVRLVRNAEGKFIINPDYKTIAESDLDIIVGATYDNITMVEGSLKEVQEEDLLEALKVAHEAIKVQCLLQKELAEATGKTQKRDYDKYETDPELAQKIMDEFYPKFYAIVSSPEAHDKATRSEMFKKVKQEYIDNLPEDEEHNLSLISEYIGKAHKKAARDLVLKTRTRLDGRALDEIRPIWVDVDYLPSAHGSAVFTRGETQALTTVTLGTKLDEQMIDGAVISGSSRFILHYNFPAFSTGEVRPNRGPGRREIGHGNLAARALRFALPPDDENPYTVRVVSDILESNGSSSMATVCAGSLALMDAGIPVKAAVSGIAMGMISDAETGQYAILSDILGDEDHLGDMDFKITGTADGITACQMDIKVDGLSYEVLKEALEQAKRGRLHILGEMNKALDKPREDMKEHAPRSVKFEVEREFIGAIIGQGGKVIQEIQRTTGTTVIIEEINNKGVVTIFANDKPSMEAAHNTIKEIITPPEVDKVYEGVVKTITEFGAFIEFMKGKEGLLHISEITWERLESMDGVMEVGEEVQVKLIEVDERSGKFRLSRKVLLPRPEGYEDRSSNRGGGGSGGFRRGGSGGSGGGNRRPNNRR